MVRLIEFTAETPPEEAAGLIGFFAALTKTGVSNAIPNL